MKKLNIILVALAISSIWFSSCKKILEKQSLSTLTTSQVFDDSLNATFALNTIYTQNQPGWYGSGGSNSSIGTVGASSLTEETSGGSPYTTGAVLNTTVGDLPSSNSASNNYGHIAAINTFIVNVNNGTIDTGTKKRMVAQCLFWRAYRYFELVKLYGGVPLVLTPLPVVGSAAKTAAQVPRSTTTQTFTQIVSDLTTAIKSLPAYWPQTADYGRITRGAAQAYLGRVLNTWASPQFNTTNDVTRWQTALTACNAAITTLTAEGFGLYPKEDVTMWTTEGSGSNGKPSNPEAVFVTEYNTLTDANGTNPETYTTSCIPVALAGKGSVQPTWTEVEAFPMIDGHQITNASAAYPYNPLLFYDNRDPRFAQTIAYNGCTWPLEGNSTNRLWTYDYFTSATAIVTTEVSGHTSTGFYLRKAVDPALTATNLAFAGTDWQEIRYAEVLLNRAEAAAQTGDLNTPLADLKAIRKRAGILAGTDGMYGLQAGMSQSQMVSAILYERQIEFAYEGKRYWDLRRYKLLDQVSGNNGQGITMTAGPLDGTKRTGLTIALNYVKGTTTDYLALTRENLVNTMGLDYVYNNYFNGSATQSPTIPGQTIVNLDSSPIAYQTADYFFAIPPTAIQNDPALLQNNTWGGPFDPTK